MNLPWLLLQYRTIEQNQVRAVRDLVAATGPAAKEYQAKEAARIWRRELAELDAHLKMPLRG